MKRFITSMAGRWLAALLCALCAVQGCVLEPLVPIKAGVREFQRIALIAVPGGSVDAAGGNLFLQRSDLSADTALGPLRVEASYNSRAERWLFNHEVELTGARFTDATGAVFDLSAVPAGEEIRGSDWIALSANAVATRGGRALAFRSDGRLDHVRWRTLAYPRLVYAWSASALRISQCAAASVCTPLFDYALDAAGHPLSVIDLRSGRSCSYHWDAEGRLETARDALDVEAGRPGTRYEWGPANGLLFAATNSQGERVEYRYRGWRIAEVEPIGPGRPLHRFEFYGNGSDPDGLFPTLYTDPEGRRWRYLIDWFRRLHRVEQLETGEVSHYSWNDFKLASHTRPDGVTTRWLWSSSWQLDIAEPSGNAVRVEYAQGALNLEVPEAWPLRHRSDALGLLEERDYDALGRVTAIRNGEGEAQSFAYHPSTTLVSSHTLPSGLVHSYPVYGVHGHWLEDRGGRPDQRLFDTAGNPLVTSLRVQEPGVLTWHYDAARQIESVDVAATQAGTVTGQGVIRAVHRNDGRPLRIERPGGGVHEFEYDSLGQLALERVYAGGAWSETSYEYDRCGRRSAQQRANGMREEWDYDAVGRVVARRALRSGALEAQASSVYASGRLISASDSHRAEIEQYGYDLAGRLRTTSYGHGEVLSREYDLRSRLTAEIFARPDGAIAADIGYAYDLADRVVEIRDRGAEQPLVAREYQSGELASESYGNGLSRSFSYDPLTRLPSGMWTSNPLGQTLETTSITRSFEVAPPRQEIVTTTTTALATTREEYWIDLDGSLSDPNARVGNRVFHWEGGAGRSRDFDYDEHGNLRSRAAGDSFVYDAEREQLLSASLALAATSASYSYDAAGFATSRGGVPITWSATGRLASFGPASFAFDFQGRPIRLQVGAELREYALFGGRIESSAAGVLRELDLGPVVLDLGTGQRRYRHADFRGQISSVSDGAGRVVRQIRYQPYGIDASFGSGDSLSFEGKLAAGPFVLMGARVYDPLVGRFLSPDPEVQLVNRYAYTWGNPVAFMDAEGRELSGRSVGAALSVSLSLVAAGAGVVAVTATAPAVVSAATAVAASAGLAAAFSVALNFIFYGI